MRTIPATSDAQRRYLAARFGIAWMRRHGFDNKGPLPEHVKHRARHAGRQALRGLAK